MTQFKTNLPDGVFAASVTPLKKDFSIDHEALFNHCNWLLDNGNNGICFMGTTGEANSFSLEERMKALDFLIEKGMAPHQLLVGTGCCSLLDTIALTKHAMSKKVGGVLMLPPFYYKGITDDGLTDYFKLVIEGVSDPNLKIYLYHFPKMTGVSFSVPFIKHLVSLYPDTVVGMKDSSGDWNNMESVCSEIPGFKLYAGTEKYFLDVIRAKGAGVISATTNLTGLLAAQVYTHRNENKADALQSKLTEARLAFEGPSFISSVKHILAKRQKNDAWLNIRPPNSNLTVQQAKDLESRLAGIDF
ncbi:MAG TPA: dihydrodipicolinate synthase family protein [Cyclobacteriaceae bacterium]|nr:dihydrodipicolinate synthase family protein [Cyclobacteriaceae bacterium]HRK55574.1 dihydrodipicolinate synthase family protein [Cyclobacteriaceae bacterium]